MPRSIPPISPPLPPSLPLSLLSPPPFPRRALDQLREGRAHHDGDRQVDDVAPHDEVAEARALLGHAPDGGLGARLGLDARRLGRSRAPGGRVPARGQAGRGRAARGGGGRQGGGREGGHGVWEERAVGWWLGCGEDCRGREKKGRRVSLRGGAGAHWWRRPPQKGRGRNPRALLGRNGDPSLPRARGAQGAPRPIARPCGRFFHAAFFEGRLCPAPCRAQGSSPNCRGRGLEGDQDLAWLAPDPWAGRRRGPAARRLISEESAMRGRGRGRGGSAGSPPRLFRRSDSRASQPRPPRLKLGGSGRLRSGATGREKAGGARGRPRCERRRARQTKKTRRTALSYP